MKHTIRHKYMWILIGVVTAVISVSLLVTNLCLEPYYMDSKMQTLTKVHERLENQLSGPELKAEDAQERMYLYLRQVTETYNIEIFLWDSYQNVVYSSGNSSELQNGNDPLAYLLGRQETVELLASNEDYQINKTYDGNLDAYYLEMFSQYSGGSFSIMRVPLESIQETVDLVNKLHLYVALLVSVTGIIAAWLLTKNMTAPILRLSALAKRMASLDFTARYDGEEDNEIGMLGESMNYMSSQLEKTISEIKTANLELKKDIEQKTKIDERRREFLSNVSHELKTPIALIQGYAEGLKEGVTEDPETMEWYCDVIADEAAKMNRMVKKLLTLNQIEAGSEQISMEHFDVVPMVRGILNSFKLPIEQKKVKLELRSPESLFIWSDEYMTEEVIRNYVGNALNHVEESGRVFVTVTKENERAKIQVRNTGRQIPEEDIDRIWDKFYKVDKARTREYGGSGIGLSIVKAVMESLGGAYGVRNEEDGVSFFCEFDC